MSNFKISDFDCKCGCGLNNIDIDILTMIQRARTIAGIPFIINSGCRCKEHNKNEGGKKDSSHLIGKAIDVKCSDSYDRKVILSALIEVGFKRIGIAKTFIHMDRDFSKISSIWLY